MSLGKTDILTLSGADLEKQMLALNWKKFQIRQLDDWLWKHGVRKFDEMTNLSKEARSLLSEKYFMPELVQNTLQESKDGTVKFRFQLVDHKFIESVLIPVIDDDRYTLCVSSQAGCSLTCSFCATGRMGLLRQLTASEIYDQYVLVNRYCLQKFDKSITNIVYMGMGEPLLNYKNVMVSVRRLIADTGPKISARRITISTAGIAKMILKLADEGIKVNLALSLHAADDVKRNKIMPINEHNSLRVLMDALLYFYKKTGNRLSYEYIAFDGFNDTIIDAKNLVRLSSQFPVMINIIEYNPVRGLDFIKSGQEKINLFAKEVLKHGIMITVRKSRGKDIDAACGQLANIENTEPNS